MRLLGRMAAAALIGGLAMGAGAAQADNVIARWIQVGPGSTAPTASNYGDDPLLLTASTNTVLARAIVSDGVCPAMTLDHSLPVTMTPRFTSAQAAQLTGNQFYSGTGPITGAVPGTAGKSNGITGYPQFFIFSGATDSSTLPGVDAATYKQATSSWTECEAIVSAGHTTATVGGVDLKLPVAHPKRILVMADVGCRMNGNLSSTGGNQQNCSTSTTFPFQFLANYEASFKPDLIVLVGDWFYRDTTCLTNGAETFAGCNTFGSNKFEVWGDTFDSWNADVFYPAKTLLAAAPWVMIRGNHESCGRGARGWFALLDPRPYSYANVACAAQANSAFTPGTDSRGNPTASYNADFEPTYIVPLGNNVNLLAHDSSFANDSTLNVGVAKSYDIDLTNALRAPKAASATNIFATHKPTLSMTDPNTAAPATYASNAIGPNVTNDGNVHMQAVFYGGTSNNSVFTGGTPANVGLMLAGHVHALQYVNASARFAPEFVVGTGGDLLDVDMNTGYTPPGLGTTRTATSTTQPAQVYSQVSTQLSTWNYVVATLPQPYTTGSTTNVNTTRNASFTQFGFAVLDAIDTNNVTTGYIANTYKASSSKSGRCLITLGNGAGQSRNVACNF